ncbi:MAG: hypothetical protein U0T82_00925 [Bacteroidales bacterium]
MKKMILSLLLLVVIIPVRFSLADEKNKDIIGNWKCEVNSAPYEYSKSTLAVTEKDGKLSATVTFENGYVVNVRTITFEKKELTMELYVDYNYIKVTGKLENNKITGTVNTPEGTMNIVVTKK